jgi:hypothetical protein
VPRNWIDWTRIGDQLGKLRRHTGEGKGSVGYSVVYLHEGFANPGDGYAYIGTRHCIQKSVPVIAEKSISLARDLDQALLRETGEPDLIIVAGAPWLWDRAAESAKLDRLSRLFDIWPTAGRIAFGIGSSLLPPMVRMIDDPVFSQACVPRIFSTFDCVVVRDEIARDLLQRAGIASFHEPDPTFFISMIAPGQPAVKRGAVITTPPTPQFLAGYMDDDMKSSWDMTVRKSVEEGFDLFLWADDDDEDYSPYSNLEISGRLGTLPPRALSMVLSRYREVRTNRVHAAALSRGLGIPVTLFGYDTRALTAGALGARIIGPMKEFESPEVFSVTRQRQHLTRVARRLASAVQISVG